MKKYFVTFTQNGEQRQGQTAQPMAFAMKLRQEALATGASIEHLTFRKEAAL